MKDLVIEMVAWQHNRYLDPGIWIHLQSKIDSAALPRSIPLPHLQPPQPHSAAIGAMCDGPVPQVIETEGNQTGRRSSTVNIEYIVLYGLLTFAICISALYHACV